jgi:hypothetical protein
LYQDEFRSLAIKSLELGQGNIKKLKSLCDKHGIALSLTVHPWQEQIIKGDTTNFYTRSWKKFCFANGISFINLFPVFINTENAVKVARQNYIQGDNHWNENGHYRVFKKIKKSIQKPKAR